MNVKTGSDNMEFRIRAEALTARMTLEEKLYMLSTHQHEISRLGLKEFFIGTEVARGYVGRSADRVSTVFPQPVGLASTFDSELMYLLGRIASDEARAYYNASDNGGLCLWGPTIDPVHDPRWGRTEEAYGEDPYLAGEMARAYTKGMEGGGRYSKTVPTLKHFCANTNEQDRGTDNSTCSLRVKHEYYYAPFRYAIKKGGARSMMASYNKVNGVPSACNRELKTLAKDEWGAWFIVTDGGGFTQISTSHRYTQSHSETMSELLFAGTDVMTDNDVLVAAAARKALADGLITEADIDRAVMNSLFARLRLGQLDKDCEYDAITADCVDSEAHRAVNLRAALEQMCLLKNDGLLPLEKQPKSIAVVGALADENLMDWYTGVSSGDVSVLEGIRKDFSDSTVAFDSLWDVVSIKAPNGRYLSAKENGDVLADADAVTENELFELQDWGDNWVNLYSPKYKKYVRMSGTGLSLNKRSVYDWFTRETFNFFKFGEQTVIEEYLNHSRLFLDGGRLTFDRCRSVVKDSLFSVEVVSAGAERAQKLASENELIVYCVGNHPMQVARECYDRKTLSLNIQSGMAKCLFEKNPATVMVLISSYPYSIAEENKILPAIIYTSHAGAHLGTAVAKTLTGENNPCARTPLTWYASDLDLADIKNYDIEKSNATYMYFRGRPLYPFGYGLSYSRFEYGSVDAVRTDGGWRIGVAVRNISDRDGEEVVQIYYSVKDSALSRPAIKLCGFKRGMIASGSLVRFEVFVPDVALEVYDVRRGRMIIESGEYEFCAASNSAEIQSSKTVCVQGEELGRRCFDSPVKADSFDDCRDVAISYSKRLHESYIRSTWWSGTAVYGGLDMSQCKHIEIMASSVLAPSKLTVMYGAKEQTIAVEASDSVDDFKMYRVSLEAQETASDSISVIMGEGVCVSSIRFIKD